MPTQVIITRVDRGCAWNFFRFYFLGRHLQQLPMSKEKSKAKKHTAANARSKIARLCNRQNLYHWDLDQLQEVKFVAAAEWLLRRSQPRQHNWFWFTLFCAKSKQILYGLLRLFAARFNWLSNTCITLWWLLIWIRMMRFWWKLFDEKKVKSASAVVAKTGEIPKKPGSENRAFSL